MSGAVFGDLDLDGDADLVLALEWGPVMVLRNDAGKFTDATKAFGLHRQKGSVSYTHLTLPTILLV